MGTENPGVFSLVNAQYHKYQSLSQAEPSNTCAYESLGPGFCFQALGFMWMADNIPLASGVIYNSP